MKEKGPEDKECQDGDLPFIGNPPNKILPIKNEHTRAGNAKFKKIESHLPGIQYFSPLSVPRSLLAFPKPILIARKRDIEIYKVLSFNCPSDKNLSLQNGTSLSYRFPSKRYYLSLFTSLEPRPVSLRQHPPCIFQSF